MKNNRTGGRGRTYEGFVSKLPPHAVTKLAADLTRRLFDSASDRTRPTGAELGACARAVGALPPKERDQHAKVLGRVRDVLFSSAILPPAVGMFVALITAKVSEAAALTEAKVSVAAYRSLVGVRSQALHAEGNEELAGEHDQTLAVLDQQLALLAQRLASAETDIAELVATDLTASTLKEARALEAALGIDVAPAALVEAAEAVQHARHGGESEISPQLKRVGELVSDVERST